MIMVEYRKIYSHPESGKLEIYQIHMFVNENQLNRERISILRTGIHNLTRIHLLTFCTRRASETNAARNLQSHCCLSDKNISIISLELFNFLQ